MIIPSYDTEDGGYHHITWTQNGGHGAWPVECLKEESREFTTDILSGASQQLYNNDYWNWANYAGNMDVIKDGVLRLEDEGGYGSRVWLRNVTGLTDGEKFIVEIKINSITSGDSIKVDDNGTGTYGPSIGGTTTYINNLTAVGTHSIVFTATASRHIRIVKTGTNGLAEVEFISVQQLDDRDNLTIEASGDWKGKIKDLHVYK